MKTDWLCDTAAGFRVQRLHTVPTLSPHTVGEHTAHMLRLVVWLAARNPTCRREACMLHALQHDVAEAYTGDLPSPVKRSAAADGLRAAEREWEAEHLLPVTLTEQEATLCKMADWLQLQEQCIHERRLGNRHVDGVWHNITRYLGEHPGLRSVAGAEELCTRNAQQWRQL